MKRRWGSLAALAALALLLSLPACEERGSKSARAAKRVRAGSAGGTQAIAKSSAPPVARRAVTPRAPARFGPALTRLQGAYDRKVHSETKVCAPCHAQIYAQWRESVHAFASLSNPYYRTAFDAFVKSPAGSKRNFCGGCHDPALMLSGKMAAADFSSDKVADDRLAHVGVTCMTCHGIAKASTDGNASYTLDTSAVPIPKKGDKASLKAHLARVGGKALRMPSLCASCHVGFLSKRSGHAASVTGLDEHGNWRRSGYAGNKLTRLDRVEAKTCVGCHMKKVKGLASHRFAGGHSALAAAIGSAEQLAAVRAMVKSAARVNVASYRLQKRKGKMPARLWIDVVIYNSGTGHRFPGGALDLRDTWLKLELLDAKGKRIASAGTRYERDTADTTALLLKASVATVGGKIVEGHQVGSFRAPVADRSIAPRDALVVRYRHDVAAGAKALVFPLRVRARLRHRRLAKVAYDAACAQSKTPRGKRFRRATKKHLGFDVDACAAQPVIEVARAEATLVAGKQRVSARWDVNYQHGLGLLHQVSEATDEARAAFEHALTLTPDKALRARAMWGLGSVSARQNRTDEALRWFAKAQALVGAQPALDFARARAEQRRFHHRAALGHYERAANKSHDERVWRGLGTCAGTVFDANRSLGAAHRGLALEPRDPDLLRLQLLALRRLGAPAAQIAAAASAFDSHKRDEAFGAIRDRCLKDQARCRRERQPIPIITLR
ncbi:MAG: tetratricopeptide repeat protein [Myxococcales bacterium]|nr:tetratricopeptide repeat protein [Myxococcales bacterium]